MEGSDAVLSFHPDDRAATSAVLRKTGESSTFPPSCGTWDKHHARYLTVL